jgi:hypothetical protein
MRFPRKSLHIRVQTLQEKHLINDIQEQTAQHHLLRPPFESVSATATSSATLHPLPGEHSAVEPPDPIPNSEVKRSRADGSVHPHARVGHRQGLHPKPPSSDELGGFLLGDETSLATRPPDFPQFMKSGRVESGHSVFVVAPIGGSNTPSCFHIPASTRPATGD